VASGRPGDLGERGGDPARITFRLTDGFGIADLPLPADAGPGGLVVVEASSPTEALHRLTGWAVSHGTELAGLTVTRPSLEDVYLQLTSTAAPASAAERTTR
jgi:ABC-2 type transport system ATP-binding protein